MAQMSNKDARIGARLTIENRNEANVWIEKLRLSGDSELLKLVFDAFRRNTDEEIMRFLNVVPEYEFQYAIGFNFSNSKDERVKIMSLMKQNESIMAYAQQMNFVVWEFFGDLAFNGDLNRATTLDDAIKRIKEGPEKVIIVEDYLKLNTNDKPRNEFLEELPSIYERVKAAGGSIRVCRWPTVEQVIRGPLPLALPNPSENWRRHESI